MKIKTAAEAANERGVLVRALDQGRPQGCWAAGWLYWLTGCAMRPHPDADALTATARVLAGWLEDALEKSPWPGPLSTKGATWLLTQTVVDAASATPGACAYRELTLPVKTPGTVRYGRLDVVVWHPRCPDLVVEIDSKPNPGSIAKLVFARDAGAHPIWVRHGSGSIDAPEGIAVIDLR